MRAGLGYDVHRLGPDRDLILGGVKIEYERGLIGHSDADVLVHAIMDALLGAAALGDIGKLFPDTDEKYKGISSMKLLSEVADRLEQSGFIVENIDAVIIAQQPKMRPYIDQMRQNIAQTLGIDISQVNVKATTEEGLGFTGSGAGISSQAVCMLYTVDEVCVDSITVADSAIRPCEACPGCAKPEDVAMKAAEGKKKAAGAKKKNADDKKKAAKKDIKKADKKKDKKSKKKK